MIILWLGWWGFNGGSALAIQVEGGRMILGDIILNTSIAAVGAGLAAFFHCYFLQGKDCINEKLLGGILGGLVAVTAGVNELSTWQALALGVTAGVVHNYSYDFIISHLKLDDAVGAVPVHGACGVLGTLTVPFAKVSKARVMNWLPR